MKNLLPTFKLTIYMLALLFPVCVFSSDFNPISAVDEIYSNMDPFSTRDEVSVSPAKNLSADLSKEPCQFSDLEKPLDLAEVVERSLCNNPQTRQTWANVKARAAEVGISKAAYLPNLNATINGNFGNVKTTVKSLSFFSREGNTTTFGYTLNLNWILFDFGLRSANLASSQFLLAAANATQDATLQSVFLTAAQGYYDLLSAQGALDASKDSEKAARESFLAAEAKYNAGVGTLADKLQAETTYSQANLNRTKANGELKNAYGALAIAMGLKVNTPLTIKKQDGGLPDTHFVKSVDALIEEAKQNHPSLLAAQAQLEAARSKIDAAKAEDLPTLALTGSMSYNNQSGIAPGDTVSTNDSIGVQVNIPLFEGFGRPYRIQSAKAQVEAKSSELENTVQQVSQEVWKSYQSISTETENIKTTVELLKSANQSFRVAQGRYKAGVGTIIELLNAQSTLADAKQQRIKALSNWRTARLKLATSLGNIGFWAI
jgi:outer membrane protein